MTATVTIACPDGCFEVTYTASIDDPDVSDREFLNEMGVPNGVAWNGGGAACPNCESSLDVDWGDDDGD